MQFRRDEDGNAVLTMTFEELGIIRYTLGTGVEKLQSHAVYLKYITSQEETVADQTAIKARKAVEELERVVAEWAGKKE